MAAPAVKKVSNFDHLTIRTSTQVARGWKHIVNDVRVAGKVAISSHDTIEAIVLSPEEYRAMQDGLDQARGSKSNALDELTRRFDQNLSSLQSPDAATKVKSLFASAGLGKRVARPKAGESF